MTNAAKYTDSSSITLEMKLQGTGRSRRLHMSISDTRLGISAAEQPKVFHKMYRAENARVAEAEGTRLGLYIIKSIITQLHGTIVFVSQEDVGTTFEVEVPIAGHGLAIAARNLLDGNVGMARKILGKVINKNLKTPAKKRQEVTTLPGTRGIDKDPP